MPAPLAPYPAPEAREAETRRLAARAGGEVVAFGASVEGRPLLAARVPAAGPAGGRAGAPRVLCAANIHGLELAGTTVALALLEALGGAPGGALGALRAAAEVWVVPSLNPDGHARAFAGGGAGTVAGLRANARGVDLNRNFPLPLGAAPSRVPFAGSGRPGAATYRGPAPLSEPEARALDALLGRERFHAVVSLHCFMGTLIPARVLGREALRAYGALARAFAAAQPRFRYPRLQSRVLDVFTGELEDHAHHVHGAWACCVEVFPVLHSLRQHVRAPAPFWRFNPRRPEVYVENDLPGVVAYFLEALRRPRPGAEVVR
jgi:predicted deacylase